MKKSKPLFPVYEFRPLPAFVRQTVLRYANGRWIEDDGEWDIAFVSHGWGAPYGLQVQLPYQKNILWSWLTGHWTSNNPFHPRGNPWHYMLRKGASAWGGDWGLENHENTRIGRAAMSKCCELCKCANGRGPELKIGDPFIAAGLLRERESKRVVTFPDAPLCMYCGTASVEKLLAKAGT